MSRVVATSIGLVLLAGAVGVTGAGASGGGGCPPPITNGSVTKAIIEDWCFEPTGIYIRPGETVTWVNRDPVPHTVTGANRAWGNYEKLKSGERVSYRFNRPGAYPYYCVYHLGMVGTVVVGDGKTPEPSDQRETANAVKRVKLTSTTSAASAEVPALPTGPGEGGVAAAPVVVGVPAALALWLVARRARRGKQRSGP